MISKSALAADPPLDDTYLVMDPDAPDFDALNARLRAVGLEFTISPVGGVYADYPELHYGDEVLVGREAIDDFIAHRSNGFGTTRHNRR